MTATAMLDLKQRLARLTETERRAAAAYLLRFKHASSAGRREMSRWMKEMDAGKKTRLSDFPKSRHGCTDRIRARLVRESCGLSFDTYDAKSA